jgi:hypothetical protein
MTMRVGKDYGGSKHAVFQDAGLGSASSDREN